MNKPTCFSLTIENHIAHLVLNRPEALNTMNMTFWRELDQILDSLHRDNQARVLVLSSTGKHFSAGMSLDAFGGEVSLNDNTPSRARPCWTNSASCKPPSPSWKTCAPR